MARLLGFVSLFLLLAVSQLHVSALVYDIEASENEAISELQLEMVIFRNNIATLADGVINLTHDVETKSKPVLADFREKLSSLSGYFEDTVAMVPDVNVSKQTCGIVDVRDYVMATYDIARGCVTKMLRDIDQEMAIIKEDSTRMTEAFESMKGKILSCKRVESENNKIAMCIQTEARKAEEYLKALTEMTVAAREVLAAYKAPAVFSNCIGTEGSYGVIRKAHAVTSCLAEKYPIFAHVAIRINRITEYNGNKIILLSNSYFNKVSDYLHYLEKQAVPIMTRIDLVATRFGKTVRKFRDTANMVVSNIWSRISG